MSTVLIHELSNASARSKREALLLYADCIQTCRKRTARLDVSLCVKRGSRARGGLSPNNPQYCKLFQEQIMGVHVACQKKLPNPLHRPQGGVHLANLGHSRPSRSQSPLQVKDSALVSLSQYYDSIRTILGRQHFRYLADQNQTLTNKDDFLLPSQDDLRLYFNTAGKPQRPLKSCCQLDHQIGTQATYEVDRVQQIRSYRLTSYPPRNQSIEMMKHSHPQAM